MEEFIEAINQLQDVFNTLGMPNNLIELPQIVMVGSQSTGKSSVLESFVRFPILPRGSGIVTRCPLYLQLIKCPLNDKRRKSDLGTDNIGTWGEFSHKKDEIFTDYDEIRQEIENQTDVMAGTEKGIVKDAINLRIYSDKVVNLTLVDLPGITKVPVGDQPVDIEEQIRSLILSYIRNEKSLILAVSPANVDFANSESLKIAREVDLNGDRTLAILSKLDLADSNEIADTLNGKVIPVKLGIIGVKLRSQQDIDNNKSIDDQLAMERKFLEKFHSKVAQYHGVPYLEQTLSDLLMNHIHKWLPKLKQEIGEKKAETERIMEACGLKVDDPCRFLTKVIASFVQDFCATVDGTLDDDINSTKEVVGGPMFRKSFDMSLEFDIDCIVPEISKDAIIKYIEKVGGARPFVFAPERLFHSIIKQHIERLRIPSISCLERINEQMEKVIAQRVEMQHEFKRFPKLKQAVIVILTGMLESQVVAAKKSINEFINMEKNSINTNHPQFSIEKALKTYEESIQAANNEKIYRSKKVEKDARVINDLVVNYFEIVKTTVKDQVPKHIMFNVIDFMKKEIQMEFSSLYKQQEDLFAESPLNVKKRNEAKDKLEALNCAHKIINKIFQDNKL